MTAIFSALDKACDMLVAQKAQFPATKCRVILLTDGEDNFSGTTTAKGMCSRLFENDIVLDAIVLGTESTSALFKICRSTGGYAFNPATQRLFYQLFLLETLLDIRTRPDIAKQRVLDWD
jgi:Mg-chelatase subunit ChlD